MKKLCIILTCLLFIPLTTQAKEFQHPTYGFKIVYPNSWFDVTTKENDDRAYLVINKTNKLSFSNIYFEASPAKSASSNLYIAYLDPQFKKSFLKVITENFIKENHNNQKITFANVDAINGIIFMVVKCEKDELTYWNFQFHKNGFDHYIDFETDSQNNTFDSEWLQIFDKLTINL